MSRREITLAAGWRVDVKRARVWAEETVKGVLATIWVRNDVAYRAVEMGWRETNRWIQTAL